MNPNNNELIHDAFADVIEWLEKFIEKSNYFPNDWPERKQNHNNSITRPDIGSMKAAQVKRGFASVLFGLKVMLGFRENKDFLKPELKTKFYQWIDATKIKVDNCPTELIPLLHHINEVLEGRGKELRYQVIQEADRNISRMSKEEREKEWSNTLSAVNEQYQKIENGEYERKEWNPNGNAEQGRETFEKIMATTSNYDIYPPEEIASDNSPEAQAAIKELKGLLEEKWTDIEVGEEKNIMQTSLKSIEKNIQDLEAFESNTTANGGKNKYAWVKLEAGGELVQLKISKSHLEGKLNFYLKRTPTSSNNKSSLFPKVAIISLILVLGIIICYVFLKESKKKKKNE